MILTGLDFNKLLERTECECLLCQVDHCEDVAGVVKLQCYLEKESIALCHNLANLARGLELT